MKHAGQTMTFSSSSARQSFACWYSDVSHEVLSVVSGYRWVLTYNLTLPPEAARPTAGLAVGEERALRHAIRRWLLHAGDMACEDDSFNLSLDPDRDSDHFYYGLEHEYTEESISFAAMKLVDRARVHALSTVSKSLPVDIFLAVLEKEERNGVYGDYDDYHYRYAFEERDDDDSDDSEAYANPPDRTTDHIESIYSIKKLVDLSGNQVLSGVKMVEDSALQTDFFGDEPDDVEESGFTGNEVSTEAQLQGFSNHVTYNH